MLEKTVWRQYHSQNNLRQELAKHCKLDITEFIEDDKVLYGVVKAKLTKKELKLFAMDTAGRDDEEIKSAFSYTDEELQKAKFKLYKKLIQDKTRLAFRESSLEN